jgi:hypothetical protein
MSEKQLTVAFKEALGAEGPTVIATLPHGSWPTCF